jgi:hypothetical protein
MPINNDGCIVTKQDRIPREQILKFLWVKDDLILCLGTERFFILSIKTGIE